MRAKPKSSAGVHEEAGSFQREKVDIFAGKFLLFLPRGYSVKSERRWPLLLFLHGMGERGNSLELVKKHGPPKIVHAQPVFPFILVAPQCPIGQWWSTQWLMALLDDVCAKHAVDPRRIYVTGLSMGGFAAWNLAVAYPERFAAVAPICGGGDPYPPHGYDTRRAEALHALPIWAFHGAKDEVVKLQESERMVNILRHFGCQITFTIYPEAGHDCWSETYNNPRLYEWFLQHQRPAKKKQKKVEKRSISRGKRRKEASPESE